MADLTTRVGPAAPSSPTSAAASAPAVSPSAATSAATAVESRASSAVASASSSALEPARSSVQSESRSTTASSSAVSSSTSSSRASSSSLSPSSPSSTPLSSTSSSLPTTHASSTSQPATVETLSSTAEGSSQSTSLSTGAIAGIAGGVAGGVLVVLVVWWAVKRGRRRSYLREHPLPPPRDIGYAGLGGGSRGGTMREKGGLAGGAAMSEKKAYDRSMSTLYNPSLPAHYPSYSNHNRRSSALYPSHPNPDTNYILQSGPTPGEYTINPYEPYASDLDSLGQSGGVGGGMFSPEMEERGREANVFAMGMGTGVEGGRSREGSTPGTPRELENGFELGAQVDSGRSSPAPVIRHQASNMSLGGLDRVVEGQVSRGQGEGGSRSNPVSRPHTPGTPGGSVPASAAPSVIGSEGGRNRHSSPHASTVDGRRSSRIPPPPLFATGLNDVSPGPDSPRSGLHSRSHSSTSLPLSPGGNPRPRQSYAHYAPGAGGVPYPAFPPSPYLPNPHVNVRHSMSGRRINLEMPQPLAADTPTDGYLPSARNSIYGLNDFGSFGYPSPAPSAPGSRAGSVIGTGSHHQGGRRSGGSSRHLGIDSRGRGSRGSGSATASASSASGYDREGLISHHPSTSSAGTSTGEESSGTMSGSGSLPASRPGTAAPMSAADLSRGEALPDSTEVEQVKKGGTDNAQDGQS